MTTQHIVKGRSKTLVEVTSLVAVVFIISCFVSITVFQNSLNRMIKKSKDRLVAIEAESISSSHTFVLQLLKKRQELRGFNYTSDETANSLRAAISTKTLSELQAVGNETLEAMTRSGMLGLTIIYNVAPKSEPFLPKPLVIMSSDSEYLYTEPPAEIRKMMAKDGDSWKLFKNGISEMELEGEYLVTAYKYETGFPGSHLWSIDFKPMYAQLSRIDSFYAEEKRFANAVMGLFTVLASLLLVLLTFFSLRTMIKRTITDPLDELSRASERIMEGNLQTYVPIREGEEFVELKTVFNDMIKSLRDIISRS